MLRRDVVCDHPDRGRQDRGIVGETQHRQHVRHAGPDAAPGFGFDGAAEIDKFSRGLLGAFELDRARRRTNVDGAFGLRSPTTAAGPTDVRGRWVILVDDVTTTGATLAACGDVLMAAGALAVSGRTVARER